MSSSKGIFEQRTSTGCLSRRPSKPSGLYSLDECVGRLQRRLVNRKRVLLPFCLDATELVQICIARCLYSYRDDLPENLGKTTAQEGKKSPLPVDVHRSKTSFLKEPNNPVPLLESLTTTKKKTSQSKGETNNKLNLHMTSTPAIKPRTHWREASAL